MPISLYEWLDKIEARPGMYFQRPGFESLCAFFLGYNAALPLNPSSKESMPRFETKFSKFVLTRLPLPRVDPMMFGGLTVHGPGGNVSFEFCGPDWQTTIENAVADDQERFRLFFTLLREFRTEELDG